MSGTSWINAAGGDFNAAGNWSAGVPGAGGAATIAGPGTYAVTLSGSDTLASLTLSDATASFIDTGLLSLTGALVFTAGSATLASGGEIVGGTLSATAGKFDWAGGTLSGTTYHGALSLTAAGESLTIANGLTVTGASGTGSGVINASGAATALDFIGTQTLNNVLINTGNALGGSTDLNFDTLTLGANTTWQQLGGNAAVGSWSIDQGSTLINNGTLATGTPGAGADIVVTALVNTGIIAATNPYGGYSLQANSFTNSGIIYAGGGIGLSVYNSFVNTGLIDDVGGVAEDALTFTNNGQIVLGNYNTYLALEGVGNATTTITNTVNGTGTITVNGSLDQIRVLGDIVFSSGTINLQGSNNLIVNSQPYPLTTPSALIFGAGAVVEQTAGTGGIDGGATFINQGHISAQYTGSTLTINGLLTNTGTLLASTGGTLNDQGGLTGNGFLDIASGGTLELAGNIGAGQTVDFLDTSASVLQLDSNTYFGGIVNIAFGGTITHFGAGQTIDLAAPSLYSAVTATSASWSAGTLDVGLSTGQTLGLAMAGNYSTTTFALKSDGVRGTDIYIAGGTGGGGGSGGGSTRSYTGTGGALTGTEGTLTSGTLATFTDSNLKDSASQFLAVVTWGDGTTGVGKVTGSKGSFSVTGTHAFTDEGALAPTITLINKADGSGPTLTGTALIAEADKLTAGKALSLAGSAGTLITGTVATFTDSYKPNTAGDFTALINWGDGTSSAGTVTDTNGALVVTGGHVYGAAGKDVLSITLQEDNGGASATASGAAAIGAPWTVYNYDGSSDTLITGLGPNLIIASASAISAVNTLQAFGTTVLSLTGTGLFDLTGAAVFSGVQTLQLDESAAAAATTIDLRGGTKLAVSVASNTIAGNGVTVVGAANTDHITLSAGDATVFLQSGEAFVSKGGNAIVHIGASSAADAITGTGTVALVVDGGGSVKLGAAASDVTTVSLSQTTNFTANADANLLITGSTLGGDTITLGSATQSVGGGGANEHIFAASAYAGDLITGLGSGATLDITSTGSATLNSLSTLALAKLDTVSTLSLNSLTFLTAVGEVKGDVINAGGTGQTLSSVLGSDTLTGSSLGADIFRGTATGLSNDLLNGFIKGDFIDITNLKATGATLTTLASGTNTVLSLSSGGITSSFTLAGAFSASAFTLSSDGGVGVQIGLR